MPISNNIYYQSQSGGLCRLHSLNAYFGKEKISSDDFNKYQIEYDNIYGKKFNIRFSCKSFDIVASDQQNIVSYILKKNDIYSRYYAINEIYRKNSNDYIVKILKGDFFFIYNESHIWGIRRLNNKWYTVNSIGGVSNLNINSVLSQKNIGFIIPVDISKEFYRNLKLIKITLGDKSNIKSISEYLVNQNKNKFILGDLEIPLGICMNILETHYDNKKNCSIDFFPIKKETLEYNKFLSLFTNGRYNDIKLINEYLPSILNKLSNLSIKPI